MCEIIKYTFTWQTFTAVLAAFGAYIAYQQFHLGREKFKLDLFEKRFSVFAGVRLFLTKILQEGQLEYEHLFAFRSSTAEAEFLFGDDIVLYIREIDSRSMSMKKYAISRKEEASQEKKMEMVHAENNELVWLTEQLPILKSKFSPYMKFKTWH